MNFFESQDSAKRSSGKLYLLFGVAVLSLIVITNLLVMFVFGITASEMSSMAATQSMTFHWPQFFTIGAGVASVVLFGSLYKINSLSSGGARVAEMLDGRLILNGTTNIKERRVLNVVEEMAIASGTPVPPVYMLEEEGINAFAAGYSPNDAVIGVSKGAVETLSRDQLQGVIAHEFSHILHGDMRINIRLIGVLHGILILGIVGQHLLSSGRYSRRSKNQGVQVALGLGLLAVGYVGVFFGNLIKAAVSRQREFLADASAVQFTRNPEGIAGALMQIANHSGKSYLQHPASSEISHTLFEESSASFMNGLYATHPPLNERIGAILPGWDGSFTLLKASASAEEKESAEVSSEDRLSKAASVLAAVGAAGAAESMISQIGNPSSQHIEVADQLIANISQDFLAAAREPSSARAVIYYLLLHSSESIMAKQIEMIEQSADVGVFYELTQLLKKEPLIDTSRFALASIAISSLRQLSGAQYQLFKENVDRLVLLDGKVSLFEWAMQKRISHSLDTVFFKVAAKKFGKRPLVKLLSETSVVLSIIAYSSKQHDMSPSQSFLCGKEKLDLKVELVPLASISIELLDEALERLNELKPLEKPLFLKSCAAVITADGSIASIESELLQAIAATIDCPMPPLVVESLGVA